MAEWERNMISERTKAGMEAARKAGKKLGPPTAIKDNQKRLARARKLDAEGKLRTPQGSAVMRDLDLLIEFNDADTSKPIRNIETVRRWRREGYPGLDE